ncbi:hypothetical protein WJX74_001698 [Apatococcus lobatus]|uniref:Uncharacterized protein n=1 Tax=Apatococcus lobatus TaxID=904363 RepID=A0AAW1QIQ4_9CHLO
MAGFQGVQQAFQVYEAACKDQPKLLIAACSDLALHPDRNCTLDVRMEALKAIHRCIGHLDDQEDISAHEPWLPGSMQAVIYAAERDPSLRVRRTATSVLAIFLKLTYQRPQQDVCECLALKARDKCQVVRATALEALAEAPSPVFRALLSAENLLAIFDANLLNIDGIMDHDTAACCLRAAADDSRTVSMTLKLFARFILGPTVDAHDGMLGNGEQQCLADIRQVLDILDEMDFVSMTDHRYAAYHAAVCHVLAGHDLLDDLLQQALVLHQDF